MKNQSNMDSAGPSGTHQSQSSPYNENDLRRAAQSLVRDLESGSLRFLRMRRLLGCEHEVGWRTTNLWEGEGGFMEHITTSFPLPPRAPACEPEDSDDDSSEESPEVCSQDDSITDKNCGTSVSASATKKKIKTMKRNKLVPVYEPEESSDDVHIVDSSEVCSQDDSIKDKNCGISVSASVTEENVKTIKRNKRKRKKKKSPESSSDTKQQRLDEAPVVVSEDSDTLLVTLVETPDSSKSITVSDSDDSETSNPDSKVSKVQVNSSSPVKEKRNKSSHSSNKSIGKCNQFNEPIKKDSNVNSNDLVEALSNMDSDLEDGEVKETNSNCVESNNRTHSKKTRGNNIGETCAFSDMERQINKMKSELEDLNKKFVSSTKKDMSSVCRTMCHIGSKIETFSSKLDNEKCSLSEPSKHRKQTKNGSNKLYIESLENNLEVVWSQYEKIRVVRSDIIADYNLNLLTGGNRENIVRAPHIKKWAIS